MFQNFFGGGSQDPTFPGGVPTLPRPPPLLFLKSIIPPLSNSVTTPLKLSDPSQISRIRKVTLLSELSRGRTQRMCSQNFTNQK